MGHRHILILGGTTEARQLAARLDARPEARVTLSLAGRTSDPVPQAGDVRTGGFGGAEGLSRWLATERVDVLIDATHPFARSISANAAQAARRTGTPLLILSRPPWEPESGDRWTRVSDMASAAQALGPTPQRVFLAVGRQEIPAFRTAPHHRYLVRSIEPPDPDALPGASLLSARGPFTQADEERLLRDHAIEVIVAKNSGGDATYAKIAAARALGLPVVLIDRTGDPKAAATVEEILDRLDHLTAPAADRGV
jgi:precorrin-6A/cobalt-precorrin-6A reductase